MEVLVILHHNRFDVLEVPVFVDVVVGGDDDAKGKLSIFADVVPLLVVSLLLLC